MDKYILMDRDGVINVKKEIPIKSLNDFAILPNVAEAFYEMQRQGINGLVLDNDEALASGDADFATINQINSCIESHVSESGGRVHDVLVCPSNDDVKYPNPALIEKAAEKYGLDLQSTFFVTASLEGLQAGWAANCRTAFVKTGKPFKTMQYIQSHETPLEMVMPDLLAAVIKIIAKYKEA